MKINVEKWNLDRIALESQIRDLKNSIRHGGTREGRVWNSEARKYEVKPVTYSPGMGTCEDYQLLQVLKDRATYLYEVRAQARGHHHLMLATMPDEDLRIFAGDYALIQEVAASA